MMLDLIHRLGVPEDHDRCAYDPNGTSRCIRRPHPDQPDEHVRLGPNVDNHHDAEDPE
jgi:hypothetical protein